MANRGCHTDYIQNGYVYTTSCINYSQYDTVYCRYSCYHGYEPSSPWVTCIGSNQWISTATSTNVPCIARQRPWTTRSPNFTEPTDPPFNWGNFTPFPQQTTPSQPYIGNPDDPDLKMNVTTEVFLSVLVVGLVAIAVVAGIIFYRAHKRNIERSRAMPVGFGNNDRNTPTAPTAVLIQLPPSYDQIMTTSPPVSDRDGIPVTAPDFNCNANNFYDTSSNGQSNFAPSPTTDGMTDVYSSICNTVDGDCPPPYADISRLVPNIEGITSGNDFGNFDINVTDNVGCYGNYSNETEIMPSTRHDGKLLTDKPPPYSMV